VTTADCLLRLQAVSKTYRDLRVLNDISCTVARADVVSIIGPSGSGKSTLLRCIGLLEPVDAGTIWLNGAEIGFTRLVDGKRRAVRGAEIARTRRHIGMVFQNFNLFPHKTILENVMEGPLVVLRQARKECREQAEALLQQVGIFEKRNEYLSRLSGGQQQRAAIARAVAMKPDLMLFDEPTSALDPELKGEVLSVIQKLCAEGMTSIIVTHEMRFAREVSNRVLMFDAGQIVEEGAPDAIFTTPSRARTREFLQKVR
jgi:polar amino acid transport system ATP-binding protein